MAIIYSDDTVVYVTCKVPNNSIISWCKFDIFCWVIKKKKKQHTRAIIGIVTCKQIVWFGSIMCTINPNATQMQLWCSNAFNGNEAKIYMNAIKCTSIIGATEER